ncbi:MAG: hypothetical protein COV57_01290 [Candidatus Liptonbacteria bacterium CG11_big_fil_rev_8_21_14_0_20_35_14]|uniref:Clp R domain-containing protein n=1 Tax=Candidatus Liptonbacteria bacterium CG11_big_fil_rev_8_21_14_0_20_35_14 TaxID=1974634 RepID=A0A2H0N7Z9_9BACT|nr:MAG: hypothetical protein COV57_01290 [Candidatus Liptonbacteria bacterium CG11_big_fil_rev_8_21_14_0_20_35_14]
MINEIKLNMTVLERFIFRTVSYITYITLTFTGLTFIISDIEYLKWLGVLICLFLIDRIINQKKGFQKISFKSKNIFLNLSPSALSLIERSLDKSILNKKPLKLVLLENIFNLKSIKTALQRLEINYKEIAQHIEQTLKNSKTESIKESREIIKDIVKKAQQTSKNTYLTEEDIAVAVLDCEDENIIKLAKLFSITSDTLKKSLIWHNQKSKLYLLQKMPFSISGFVYNTESKSKTRIINRAWTSRPTPTLDKFGLDLTSQARYEKIGFLIGHKKEYDELEDILSKKQEGNVLLIGDPKVGKKTLVSHLAWRIVRDEVKNTLFDMRLISLDITRLISGTDDSEASKTIQLIIQEILSAKNVILYIDKIDLLFKTNHKNASSLADALNGVFKNEHFKIISSITKREYTKSKNDHSSFITNFEPVLVNEINLDEAENVLVIKSIILENQYRHKILITIPAIKKAVYIAYKYLHEIPLPESAIRILEEATEETISNDENKVTQNTVISIAERKINVPLRTTNDEEAEKLLNLENIIHQKFIDQNEAVSAVASMLRQHRSGLSRPKAPIASFLFVGPTGVGKTELAKILAEYQFGSQNNILRFDMTEFQDESSIIRLIGGNERVGQLTESVKQKPYSLILLDEFEKAHPDIINIFLQVFDDGHLTDTYGSKTIFENTIIIATSNAHSNFIIQELDKGSSMVSISNDLKNKLTEIFKPELLNRFSKIIVFKNLSKDDTEKIAQLKLNELAKTLDETKNITIKFTDHTVKTISEIGYSKTFGARPLREAINENLKNPIAEKILKNEINKEDTLEIDAEDGKFFFRTV